MRIDHLFWGFLTFAMLVWYCILTVYIGYRGLFDIRQMLDRLSKQHAESASLNS